MLTRESGFLETGGVYLRQYIAMFLGVTLYVGITGGLSLAGVSLFLEDAFFLYTMAVLGVLTHLSAFILRDIWTKRIDIEAAMEFGENRTEAILINLIVGVYLNILLFGTVLIASTVLPSLPTFAVIGFALYYPAVDLWLLRYKGHSPAGFSIYGCAYALVFIGLLREVSLSDFPVIGDKNPKQPI